MRQLQILELKSVNAGCSSCQQHLMASNIAVFNGTLLGMAASYGLYMLTASIPVAIGSGILVFAGTAYYSYYNVKDSFIGATDV